MSARDRLVKAVAAEDWATISDLGWTEVFDAFKRWWPGAFTADDARALADVHGHRRPTDVLAALRRAVDDGARFRPTASELGVLLAANAPAKKAVSPQPHPGHESVLGHVARLVADGAVVCACSPRPATVVVDAAHVLRCPSCGGLELGQAESATDADDLRAAA